MYRPRYLSLHEAVQAVADHLAKADPQSYRDTDAAFDAACEQLVQGLFDGAVRSEGLFWEPLPPDDYQEKPILPPKRTPVDQRCWSNGKHHVIVSGGNGKHSTLDVASVSWNYDSIAFEDEWETQYLYHDIRIPASDIEREFLSSAIYLSEERPGIEGIVPPSDDLHVSDVPAEFTYLTGAPGRPTSMHLLKPEMRRRFEGGEQLPTMKAEAESLSQWLSKAHPEASPTKPKTIQTKLGSLFRQLTAEVPK